MSAPVENLLSHLEGVKRNGAGAVAKCPGHDDRRQSLSISTGSDGRALLNCHAGCDLEQIISPIRLTAADLFDGARSKPIVEAEYEYRDEAGELLFVVERRIPKDFRQKRPDGRGGWEPSVKGVRRVPYRLPQLLASGRDELVFIAEGERDVDNLARLDLIATTNAGGAAKWPAELNEHFRGRRVVILPDNDEAGRKHAETVRQQLEGIAASVHVVNLPDLPEKGDVTDWLRSGGAKAALLEIVRRQTDPLGDVVVGFAELSDKIRTLYRDGFHRGVSTGLATVDPFYTIRQGDLNIITGIPSHGKSTLLDFVMAEVIRQHEWPWGVFSAENLPLERHAASLLSKFLRRPFTEGLRPRMTDHELQIGIESLNDYVKWIAPRSGAQSVERLLEIADAMVDRYGIKALVIDPWNELDHSRPSTLTETEFISRSLSQVRNFARDRQVAVFVIAHPTKLKKQDGSGSYPVPSPYDISGSAHWRNKADNCLSVWRDVLDEQGRVQLHVQKIRFAEVGRPGRVDLGFEKSTGCYFDLEEGPN